MRRETALVLAIAVLSGCSDGSGDAPKPIEGAPREVTQAVAALEASIRDRDFKRICGELFSDSARERAGGEDCAELVRSTAGNVRRPKISPLSIRVRGDRADVRVRTTAQGQAAIEDTIRLVRERDSWRIAALTSAGG